MRTGLVVASAVLLAGAGVAAAAGRSSGEVCVNAGFRAGTLAFDQCVARVEGDDPLAGLEAAVGEEAPAAGGQEPTEDMAALAATPREGKLVLGGIHLPASEREYPGGAVVGQFLINGTALPLFSTTGTASASPPPPPVSSPSMDAPFAIPPVPEPSMPSFTTPGWVWNGMQ